MGRIFLSYAREDRAFAENLARVLEDADHSVWWDRHIDRGEEFSAEIEAELDKCDAVLVAWSRQSVKSRWVRDEAAVGGDTGRLVPVSVDGSLPPMGFRQFHSLDLAGWKGGKRDERTGQLLHAIERRISGKQDERSAPSAATGRASPAFMSKRVLLALAAALLLFAAAVVGYLMFNRASQTADQPRLTIGLIPLTATSADAGLRDIAAQATDSLSHTLPQSGVPVRMLAAQPTNARKPGDFVISGEVSRSSDKLLAIVRLDHGAEGVTVFTHRFEASEDEIANLPERIGAQIAGTIAWAAPLIELEMRHPSDPSVTADLLRQLDFLGDRLQAYQSAKRAAARDPDSAFAQVALAFASAFNFAQLPRPERAQAVAEGRAASMRAIKLAPEFGDAYSADCYLRSETLRLQCEDRLRAARRIDPNSPFVDAFLSGLLRAVGRLNEADDLAQLSYARDPYVPTKIGWMLRSLESRGERDEAEALYRQGVRWWPEFRANYFENRLLSLLERGDWESIRGLEQGVPPDARPRDYADSTALYAALKSKSSAAAKAACPEGDDYLLNLRCLIAAASLGDMDSAFALADRLYPNRVGSTPAETENIWLNAPDAMADIELITSPAAAPLRADPRYLALAKRVGLLDYWRSGRSPDFCRKKPEPVCTKLLKR